MVAFHLKGCSTVSCSANITNWFRYKYYNYAKFVSYHYWKVILVVFGILALCLLGFKSVKFENDLIRLWIMNSSRLKNETEFLMKINDEIVDKGSVETVLHVNHDINSTILTQDQLLEHMQLLEMIFEIRVTYGRRTYGFHDICQRIRLPRLQSLDFNLRRDIENMLPCQIISPVNCFWDSSKLMIKNQRIRESSFDYDYKFVKVDWRTFDLQRFPDSFSQYKYKFFKKLFKDCGISRGFVDKQCIDTSDPHCPNKTKDIEDYYDLVRSGCSQIASNLYNYPANLMVGKQLRTLQTMLLLRSPSDILASINTKSLIWTESKVQLIINLWQNKMRKTVIDYNTERPYLPTIRYRNRAFQTKRMRKSSFYVFTNNSLQNALNDANNGENMIVKYVFGLGLMALLMVIIFLKSNNLIQSHCWLGLIGVGLISISMVAGLGLSAAAEIPFSMLTNHVAPFFLFGFSIDEIFILTSRYFYYIRKSKDKEAIMKCLSKTLYDSALIVLVSLLLKGFTLISGLLITVPLMFNFSVQIIIIVLLKTLILLIVYPCFLHMDSIRQATNRVDLICCLVRRTKSNPIIIIDNDIPSGSSSHLVFSAQFSTSNKPIPSNSQFCQIKPTSNPSDLSNKVANISTNSESHNDVSINLSNNNNNNNIKVSRKFKSSSFWKYRISKTIVHIIALVPVQITIIIILLIIISLGIYAAIKLEYGLIRQSIFIRDTNEYNYVKFESASFKINTFDVVTKKIDYLTNRDVIVQLHRDLMAIRNVDALQNGKFWMEAFIDWLYLLQNDYNRDVKNGHILLNGSWFNNISDNGRLALTLLVQNGNNITYNKLSTSKLIDPHGNIDPYRFYFYLNIWASVYAQFESFPCILYPRIVPINIENYLPNNEMLHPRVIMLHGFNLHPMGRPLEFVSCKYYYIEPGANDTSVVKTVLEIRKLLEYYSSHHQISSQPIGPIFSMSEQYLDLKSRICICAASSVISIIFVTLSLLQNVCVTLILSCSWIVGMLALIACIYFAPFLSMLQLPLNATSALSLLWGAGLCLQFSTLITMGYLQVDLCKVEDIDNNNNTNYNSHVKNNASNINNDNNNNTSMFCCLSINEEQKKTLEVTFSHNCLLELIGSTFFSLMFISMTNIDFLKQHFFLLPLVSLIFSLFLCYCVIPLSLVHFVTIVHPTNKPFKNPILHQRKSDSKHHRSNQHHTNLSTIPEESSSYKGSTKSNSSNTDIPIISTIRSVYTTTNSSNTTSFAKADESSQKSHSQKSYEPLPYSNIYIPNIHSYVSVKYPPYPHSHSQFNPTELSIETSFMYNTPVHHDV